MPDPAGLRMTAQDLADISLFARIELDFKKFSML